MPGMDQGVDEVITEDDTAELVAPPPEPCGADSEVLVPLEVVEEALVTNLSDPGTSDTKMLEEHCSVRKVSSAPCGHGELGR